MCRLLWLEMRRLPLDRRRFEARRYVGFKRAAVAAKLAAARMMRFHGGGIRRRLVEAIAAIAPPATPSAPPPLARLAVGTELRFALRA